MKGAWKKGLAAGADVEAGMGDCVLELEDLMAFQFRVTRVLGRVRRSGGMRQAFGLQPNPIARGPRALPLG